MNNNQQQGNGINNQQNRTGGVKFGKGFKPAGDNQINNSNNQQTAVHQNYQANTYGQNGNNNIQRSDNTGKKESSGKKIIATVVAAVLCVIIAVGGIFIYKSNNLTRSQEEAIEHAKSLFSSMDLYVLNATIASLAGDSDTVKDELAKPDKETGDFWEDVEYTYDGKVTHAVLNNKKYHDKVIIDCPSGDINDAVYKYEN